MQKEIYKNGSPNGMNIESSDLLEIYDTRAILSLNLKQVELLKQLQSSGKVYKITSIKDRENLKNEAHG